jgi:hypothetical protein
MNGRKHPTGENLIPSLGIEGTAEDIASQTWLTRRKSHKKVPGAPNRITEAERENYPTSATFTYLRSINNTQKPGIIGIRPGMKGMIEFVKQLLVAFESE